MILNRTGTHLHWHKTRCNRDLIFWLEKWLMLTNTRTTATPRNEPSQEYIWWVSSTPAKAESCSGVQYYLDKPTRWFVCRNNYKASSLNILVNIFWPITWSPNATINDFLLVFFSCLSQTSSPQWDCRLCRLAGRSENAVTETKPLTWKSIFSFQGHLLAPA